MEKLPYLRAVAKETLRLHAPAPLLVTRESICPTKIDGYNIPAKSLVMINVYSISRDLSYWERPHEFERRGSWAALLTTRVNILSTFPLVPADGFTPVCNFAMAVVELAIANLLYAFDWELPAGMGGDDLDMSEKNVAIARKKTPLLVVAKPVQIVPR